jgi:hypothetical protein
VRWALAWTLYWLGDLVERWNDNDGRFTEAGFDLYQWLMRASDTVQGASANGPWSTAQGTEAQRAETTSGSVHDGPVTK